MFKFQPIAAIALAAGILSACTQTPATPSRALITADPVMSKYDGPDATPGGGGCPGGGQQQGTAAGRPCLPYDDPNGQPRLPRTPGQPQSGGGGNQGGQQGGRP